MLESIESNNIFCFTVNNLSAGIAQNILFGRLVRVLSCTCSFVGNGAVVGEISSYTIDFIGDIRPQVTGVTAVGRIFNQFANRLATGTENNNNVFSFDIGMVCTGMTVRYDTASINQNNSFNFVCQLI